MSRKPLLELVPRNARMSTVVALIRALDLGTVEERQGTGEVLIRLDGMAGTMRMTSTRQDAGLRLVAAVRKAVARSWAARR
jgi:hypothetical protein